MLSKKDLLETMEGHEILSLHFEGCVGIYKGQIWREGKIIVPNPTRKQLTELLDEMFYNEFGFWPTKENFKKNFESELKGEK